MWFAVCWQTKLSFRFIELRELRLARNRLSTLANQGLSNLPNLELLDVRYNVLESLPVTIRALSKCAKLKTLFLLVCKPAVGRVSYELISPSTHPL